jgi:hypothetical protein
MRKSFYPYAERRGVRFSTISEDIHILQNRVAARNVTKTSLYSYTFIDGRGSKSYERVWNF